MSKVDTKHPSYAAMADQWAKCRAAVSGQKAVHAAGEVFLPKLKDQEDDDYKAYRMRASFFNATWRTVSALSGLIFRKPPVIEAPVSALSLMDDVTLSGISFTVFAQQAAIEILTTGRAGVLVDYPQQSTEGMTLADADAMKIRPAMQMYNADEIINWKTARVGNDTSLTLVVLREQADISTGEFEHKTETVYRALDLTEGAYRVRLFRVTANGEDEQLGGDILPLMNGKTLSYIPFYFLGVDNTTPDIDEPPLIDLVDVNLAHYRMTADYTHGLHFTGLPTAVISGYVPENSSDKLYIGSASAWCFPDPQAKAFFLEFTGQGLGALEKAIDLAEQQMAILGARLLTSEKKDAETAQTAQIHRAGESSILSAIAQTISDGLTKALNTFCEWAGAAGGWSVKLNREFMPVGITPQELSALLQGWQMGAPGLSDEGLFNIFKEREMIQDDVTLEDEQARIASKPIPKIEMGE